MVRSRYPAPSVLDALRRLRARTDGSTAERSREMVQNHTVLLGIASNSIDCSGEPQQQPAAIATGGLGLENLIAQEQIHVYDAVVYFERATNETLKNDSFATYQKEFGSCRLNGQETEAASAPEMRANMSIQLQKPRT